MKVMRVPHSNKTSPTRTHTNTSWHASTLRLAYCVIFNAHTHTQAYILHGSGNKSFNNSYNNNTSNNNTLDFIVNAKYAT